MKLLQEFKINYVNDTVLRNIFMQCVSIVGPDNCDYVYTDAFNVQVLKDIKLEKNICLLSIRDHLFINNDEQWAIDKLTNIEQQILKLTNDNPETMFILFIEYFNLEKWNLMKFAPNIRTISWMGSIFDDATEYIKLTPVTEKNFQAEKTIISLNRAARPHRLVLVSYLYGLGLEKNIHISLLQNNQINENTSLLDIVDWEFSNSSHEFQNTIKMGFTRLYDDKTRLSSEEPYNLSPGTCAVEYWNNANNFNQNLRSLYSNSLLEIVSETLYETKVGIITEKYLNTVYGYNFPILISVPGTVKFLRDFGFDMFDDVVDHSYDEIEDNLLRIETAIQNNLQLITDRTQLISCWQNSMRRFDDNLKFAKTEMYEKLYNESIINIKNIIDNAHD